MKYLILGNGFVGNFLVNSLPDSELYTERIGAVETMEKMLAYAGDRTIINCIGKTGRPNVDWCETHQEETRWANVCLPTFFGVWFKNLWVHIGSGCVYNGYEKAWTENDPPNFTGSYYSQTKKDSQDFLSKHDNCLILRIRMPITPDLNHKRGYIGKIRQYVREGRSLFDLQNSMTYLPDLSKAIEYLTHSNPPFTGTYNMVNPRSLSPLDVAKLCHEKLGDPEPKVLSYEEIRKTIACDRSNCLLSCKKLRKTGFELDPITKIMDQIIK